MNLYSFFVFLAIIMKKFKQIQQLFQKYLEDNLFSLSPPSLYEPANYILNLGGKRLRPILTLLGHQCFDESIEKSLPAALAIEIFHNFSLVHDDIIDQAPLRRGKPSVHVKYNLNTGILSGDLLLIYAYEFLSKIADVDKVPQALKIFNKAAIEVCEGQQYDIDFESRNDVSIKEYIMMIEGKTAALIGGSLELGALVGGASKENQKNLEAFGRNIGIAFQLQDDILDTFGDPKKFGKKVGGDIAQNKKTFLILKALETANFSQKEKLNFYYQNGCSNDQEKIQAVKSIFKNLEIRQLAENERNKYQKLAFTHLEKVTAPKASKTQLIQLANELLVREI